MHAVTALGFLCLGVLLGGVLNVVVRRLPAGRPLFRPLHCPACGHALSVVDSLPVVGLALQKGKCRHCGSAISLRCVVIEGATGVGFGVIAALRIAAPEFTTLLVLWLIAVAVTAIDLEHRIIPNRLLAAGAILLLATMPLSGGSAYLAGLEGGLLLFAAALLIAVLGRGGFGFGDVKYLAVIGLALGPGTGLLALLLAIFMGGVYAAALLVSRRAGRKDTIAFGPFIAAASVLAPLIVSTALVRLGGVG